MRIREREWITKNLDLLLKNRKLEYNVLELLKEINNILKGESKLLSERANKIWKIRRKNMKGGL